MLGLLTMVLFYLNPAAYDFAAGVVLLIHAGRYTIVASHVERARVLSVWISACQFVSAMLLFIPYFVDQEDTSLFFGMDRPPAAATCSARLTCSALGQPAHGRP
jgi:hypothetical protein